MPFSDQMRDINPKSWTKKFQKNSISYLIQMAAFYHLMSIGLLYLGDFLVTQAVPDYEAPSFPVSIIMALTSGPIEESLFFGIPYFLSGNPQVMLVTGAIWSVAHIFSTQTLALNALGYVSFLTTIPHMFFSLRTWASGKGWFAIAFHSAWNLTFLLSYCSAGIRACTIFGQGDYALIDLFAIFLALSVISVLCLLYKKSKMPKSIFVYSMVGSITVLIISEIVINLRYAQMVFSNL